MSRLTVRHWSVQSDPTGPDLDFHTMSERYNHLRPGSAVNDRVESMPFYSRPFTIAVWASQISYIGSANPQMYPAEADSLDRGRYIAAKRAEIEAAYFKAAENLKKDKQEDLLLLAELAKKRDEAVKNITGDAAEPDKKTAPSTEVKLGQGSYNYAETKLKYSIDFHVPPNSINWQYQHALIKNKTRGGWQIERSPENLVVLEVEGTSGIFYHGDHGATRLHAKSSYGYKELMDLAQVYRNNGMSYDPISGVIYTIGEVLLYYDNAIYTGSFDAFDLKENDSSPFKFDYNFTFVSRGEQGQSNVIGHNSKEDIGLMNLRASSLVLPGNNKVIVPRTQAVAQEVREKSPVKVNPSSDLPSTVELVTPPLRVDPSPAVIFPESPFNFGGPEERLTP